MFRETWVDEPRHPTGRSPPTRRTVGKSEARPPTDGNRAVAQMGRLRHGRANTAPGR